MPELPIADEIPTEWLPEADAIVDALRDAGWTQQSIADRVRVKTDRNPRYIYESVLLTAPIVQAEGVICTCCVVAAEPAGRQPEQGYTIHAWRMGELMDSIHTPDAKATGQAMAKILLSIQHTRRDTDTEPGGWVLPRGSSRHYWVGGPAWREDSAQA